MSAPLIVKLLAARYRLLNTLLTPVLFMFRRICNWQDKIQSTLSQRGWEDALMRPQQRKVQAKEGSKQAKGGGE
jgi:hypothetical protein